MLFTSKKTLEKQINEAVVRYRELSLKQQGYKTNIITNFLRLEQAEESKIEFKDYNKKLKELRIKLYGLVQKGIKKRLLPPSAYNIEEFISNYKS